MQHKELTSIGTYLPTLEAKLSDVDPGLIPYALIRHLTPLYWKQFIEITANLSGSYDKDDDSLTTSCFNTIYALSIIMLGENTAKNAIKQLTYCEPICLQIPLPSGKTWNCTIVNFMSSNVFHPEQPEEKSSVTDGDNNLKHVQLFIDSITPTQSQLTDGDMIAQIRKSFQNKSYDFNEPVTSALIQEIQKNKAKTTAENTHIYFIAIIDRNRKNIADYYFTHAFLIQQLFLAGKVRYIIYQSWKTEATLADDFDTRKYGKKGENAYSESEIVKFLQQFKLFCSTNKKDTEIGTEQCFGYKSEQYIRHVFENDTLSGPCVRYFSAEINPKHSMANVSAFVKAHTDLKSGLPKKTIIASAVVAGAAYLVYNLFSAQSTGATALLSELQNSSDFRPQGIP